MNQSWHYSRSGALAGAISAFLFTVIHDIFISNIWFAALIMIIAGALCGLCLGWSYSLLFDPPAIGSWIRYNLLYVIMLMLLGLTSVLLFEPVVSMAALMALNGPPDDLIREAMPMTLLFTLGSAIAISLCTKRSWPHFGAILLTTTILVLLLGLNVSALGLVSIPSGSLYLVAEFLGLIVVINVIFVVAFIALEWRGFLASSRPVQPEKGASLHQ
jgi:hypothetical protein